MLLIFPLYCYISHISKLFPWFIRKCLPQLKCSGLWLIDWCNFVMGVDRMCPIALELKDSIDISTSTSTGHWLYSRSWKLFFLYKIIFLLHTLSYTDWRIPMISINSSISRKLWFFKGPSAGMILLTLNYLKPYWRCVV